MGDEKGNGKGPTDKERPQDPVGIGMLEGESHGREKLARPDGNCPPRILKDKEKPEDAKKYEILSGVRPPCKSPVHAIAHEMQRGEQILHQTSRADPPAKGPAEQKGEGCDEDPRPHPEGAPRTLYHRAIAASDIGDGKGTAKDAVKGPFP